MSTTVEVCPVCKHVGHFWVEGEPGLIFETPLIDEIRWAERLAKRAGDHAEHVGRRGLTALLRGVSVLLIVCLDALETESEEAETTTETPRPGE